MVGETSLSSIQNSERKRPLYNDIKYVSNSKSLVRLGTDTQEEPEVWTNMNLKTKKKQEKPPLKPKANEFEYGGLGPSSIGTEQW